MLGWLDSGEFLWVAGFDVCWLVCVISLWFGLDFLF